MGRLRILVVVSMLVALGLVLGSGCREATQVTLDISLTKNALCTETNGTAITVGVDPASTEDRVAHGYVTATTPTCDPPTREIGTLVLTPGGSGRASVIVVVASSTVTTTSCTPPLFKGCIVARRQFSFTDHRHLQMPISIDVDCRDVPCDAFSTCRSGKCFPSEATCNGDTCTEPGDPGDGGTAVDGHVIPDTGMPVDGSPDLDGAMSDGAVGTDGSVNDGATDGPTLDSGDDGGTDSGVPAGVYCDVNGNLFCPQPMMCNSDAGAGCLTLGGPFCRLATTACNPGETQYCCEKATCPMPKLCTKAAVAAPPPFPGPAGASMNPVDSTPAGECH